MTTWYILKFVRKCANTIAHIFFLFVIPLSMFPRVCFLVPNFPNGIFAHSQHSQMVWSPYLCCCHWKFNLIMVMVIWSLLIHREVLCLFGNSFFCYFFALLSMDCNLTFWSWSMFMHYQSNEEDFWLMSLIQLSIT
jgi:hypothetical protein